MRTNMQKIFFAATLVSAAVPSMFAQKTIFGLQADATPKKLAAKQKIGGADASELRGRYTFNVHGAGVTLSPSAEVVALGSLELDGKGHVTTGEADVAFAGNAFAKLPISGTYTLNNDGTGSLTIETSQFVGTFALSAPLSFGAVKHASLLETDGQAGTAGTLDKQTSIAPPDGGYALNLSGQTVETTVAPNAVAVAGNLNIIGGFLEGSVGFFVNDQARGTAEVIPAVPFPATITAPDQFGRFELTLSIQGVPPIHFVAYTSSATQFNLIPADAPSELLPILSGSAIQ